MSTILFLISVLIVAASQGYIQIMYRKYSKVKNEKGLTGADVARKILKRSGLDKVYVVETQGFLTDHYDPSRKVVRLSSSNYNDTSISAVSVAAHECGHAIQDKEGYIFMRIRAFLVPFTNFASKIGYVVLLIGLIASLTNLILLGILLEMVVLLFQIVTLPVEVDASKRALAIIKEDGYLNPDEYSEGKSVLIAAALTYVASVASNMLDIIRLFLIFSRRD